MHKADPGTAIRSSISFWLIEKGEILPAKDTDKLLILQDKLLIRKWQTFRGKPHHKPKKHKNVK